MKIHTFSVKDCKMTSFNVDGKGGQKRDHTQTGVRLFHEISGASGEGRSHRSQKDNKKEAFLNLIKSLKFKIWHNRTIKEIINKKSLEDIVSEQMSAENLKVEVRTETGWNEL